MDTLALAALVVSTAWSMLTVPDLHAADLMEPTVAAATGTPLVLTALLALRFADAPPVWERRVLAVFLVLMPGVYLAALALHGAGEGWLSVELAGLLVFGALAIAGLRRSGWWLVLGIAGHGIGWDLWHYGRASFMADWYALGCLIIDVGWSAYAASRVEVWDARPAVAQGGIPISRRTAWNSAVR